MNEFKFLTIAQVKALSDTDRATYDAALAAYKEAFLADNPNGVAQFTADITTFGIIQKMVNGKPRVSIGIDPDDLPVTVASAVCAGPKNDTILLAPGRADVIAQNGRFLNFAHMGISTTGALNPGQFTIDVALHVQGERWTGKVDGKATSGTYKSTHLAIVGFTYVPSVEMAGKLGKLVEKAAGKGFEDMLYSNVKATATTKVEVEVDAEEEDINA
jgi:hypothetical protein